VIRWDSLYNFPAFHGYQYFIALFARPGCSNLSWVTWIQSLSSNFPALRQILQWLSQLVVLFLSNLCLRPCDKNFICILISVATNCYNSCYPLTLIVYNSRVAVIGARCLAVLFRPWGSTKFLSDFVCRETNAVKCHDDESCSRRRHLGSQSVISAPLWTPAPVGSTSY
jgi:hypothetical protein